MGSGGEWNAGDSGDSPDYQRVTGHIFDGLVARHRRHRHELDLGIAVSQDHYSRIVVAEVAIQNDPVRHSVRPVAVATR